MIEQEKLVGILSEIDYVFVEEKRNTFDTMEYVAEYLAEKGAIVLPYKLGEEVYCLGQPCGGCEQSNPVATCQLCNRWEIICCEFDYDLIPSWEETVFPTREEAEAALKKRVKGEQNEKM